MPRLLDRIICMKAGHVWDETTGRGKKKRPLNGSRCKRCKLWNKEKLKHA